MQVLQKDQTKRITAEEALKHPWLAGSQKEIGAVKLDNVVQNLKEFCEMNNFKKTVISIIASL